MTRKTGTGLRATVGLMWYECSSCGTRMRLKNTHSGYVPRRVRCPTCAGSLTHSHQHLDEKSYTKTVNPGQLFFRSMHRREAEEIAYRRLSEVGVEDPTTHESYVSLVESIFNGGKGAVLDVVLRELLWRPSGSASLPAKDEVVAVWLDNERVAFGVAIVEDGTLVAWEVTDTLAIGGVWKPTPAERVTAWAYAHSLDPTTLPDGVLRSVED